MAEAAVEHVPTVKARASGQGVIPDESIKAAYCSVLIDLGEELLGQLYLF